MSYLGSPCGIDEAGRGPWAGPVCAGAVILDPGAMPDGLTDSKKLSPARRETLAVEIRAAAIAFGLGWASAEEIDALNIRQATHLAMRRAVTALARAPDFALVDGNGDLTEPAISAASILAKTARDALMEEMEARHPGYGFAAHKGYGTPAHKAALTALGPCAIHRMSFAPVRAAARAA